MVAEAVHEIQTDGERVFAMYLLDSSVKKVTVDGGYLRLRDEPEEAYQVRTLNLTLDQRNATNERQALEIRDLKSQLEVKNDLRLKLDASRSAEQAAHQKAEDDIGKFVDTNIRLRGQLAETRNKCDTLKGQLKVAADGMRGLHRKAADFEGKAIKFERRAKAAEQKL